MVIRTIFEQKMKAIKISFFEKLPSKEKATFLWFDIFLLVIIINYTPSEREFNEHSKNLNGKALRQLLTKLWPFIKHM